MRFRNSIFILIAIYFVFTYLSTIPQWSLNKSLGWDTDLGRDRTTYLLPFWFSMIFLLYQLANKRKHPISNTFFWSHVIITVVPTLYINYPFAVRFLHIDNPSLDLESAITRSEILVSTYYLLQLVFFVLPIIKVFKKKN